MNPQPDTPTVQTWISTLITLGVSIAAAVVGHSVAAPAWMQAGALLIAAPVAAILAWIQHHYSHASYKAQLQTSAALAVIPTAVPPATSAQPDTQTPVDPNAYGASYLTPRAQRSAAAGDAQLGPAPQVQPRR